MTTSLSGSFTGTVCRKSALAMVKIMVLAPIPSVRESTASSVKPGRFISIRQPYFKSCRNTLIDPPAVHLQKFRSRLIIGNLRGPAGSDSAQCSTFASVGFAVCSRGKPDGTFQVQESKSSILLPSFTGGYTRLFGDRKCHQLRRSLDSVLSQHLRAFSPGKIFSISTPNAGVLSHIHPLVKTATSYWNTESSIFTFASIFESFSSDSP